MFDKDESDRTQTKAKREGWNPIDDGLTSVDMPFLAGAPW